MTTERKKWRDLPIGGVIITGGNAQVYQTGNWRTKKPVIDLKRCTNCMTCWVYCPEGVILVKNGKITGVDLEHCKGCGICAVECPTKVIEMVKESKDE
ncbi:MAG: 4Fe-4S binding protein [Thaumarchaeota archaeon]|nr:4Fe-4S binding protein [Nitrososphaerota archaeon]MCL5318069.1 4Fe-4S binding protein [Nitrososphaerota archaeon]